MPALTARKVCLTCVMRGTNMDELNLGFLNDMIRWNLCKENGQNGNYQLFFVTVKSPFGNYKIGDKIYKMDISLISGKIDIHRENKDLLTFDIKPKFVVNCTTCSNTGQIGIGYHEPEWDNCPDCTPKRGVR